MTQRLFPDPESLATIRSLLDRIGFDVAQEVLRGDYLASPFPHYESFSKALGPLDAALSVALRLLSLGQSIETQGIETALGSDVLESLLATGLVVIDEAQSSVSTDGFVLASRLGQYFVVSTNPYYPGFNRVWSDVYLGPESLTLINHLQRRAPRSPLERVRARSLFRIWNCWTINWLDSAWARLTGVDLSPLAVEVANFNAALNDLTGRYRAIEGDLFEPLGDQRFALIVANPPFIPVPEGTAFPVYGNGGEDGLLVMRPLLAGLACRLTAEGRAIAYAEGVGDQRGPLMLDQLEQLAANGYSIGVTLTSTITADQALFSFGRLLSMQRPSRLDELTRWQESFALQGITRYDKMLIEVRPGSARVVIRSVAARA